MFRQGDDEIEHNFEFGRPVAFFSIVEKDKIKYFNFTSTVSYVDGDRMVVALPKDDYVQQLQSASSSVRESKSPFKGDLEGLYILSGTSIPRRAIPFFRVFATFFARSKRNCFFFASSSPRIE